MQSRITKKFFATQLWKNPSVTLFPYKAAPKLAGLVLDFSGTTCDAHVIAPAYAFVAAFEHEGVDATMSEAREPMGLRKDLHINKMLEIPSVIAKWKKKFGVAPTLQDGARIFKNFRQIQLDCLHQYSELLPGTNETVSFARKLGMKIGVTTGFTRDMVDVLLHDAKPQGFVPDFAVAGDDVLMGFRPAPYMVLRNMELMGIYDRRTVVKVDDTVGGVGEGLNTGCWTIGLCRYSNYTNIDTIKQWKEMSKEDFEKRVEQSRNILLKSGAHYVVDSIKELPEALEDINQRLARGESP
jgi:phosphonoacetaldehyde hydrolase